MSTDQLEDLRAQAKYARERYQLYKAKAYGQRATSPERLRELQRAYEQAEARLRFAEAEDEHGHTTRDSGSTGPEPLARVSAPEQPLELILARNLVSIISLAAFLVNVEGHIVFYNDAAAAIIGSPFEETGPLTREQWNARLQPSDEDDAPLPSSQLPLAAALREGRPVYARIRIRVASGPVEIEAGALPLVGPAGHHGAIVVFWVPPGDGRGVS